MDSVEKIVFRIMRIAIILTLASVLATYLFGNTSWLSGTGLTVYDRAYIGEGGALRKAGESAMYPISLTYEAISRKAQQNIIYDWNEVTGNQFKAD